MIDYFLEVENKEKYKIYGEHKDKLYYVYLDFFPKDEVHFVFRKRIDMEEFIYELGFEKYTYKSSNGKTIQKQWTYIDEELSEWKNWYGTKKNSAPKKYTFDDFMCGHFIKENNYEI